MVAGRSEEARRGKEGAGAGGCWLSESDELVEELGGGASRGGALPSRGDLHGRVLSSAGAEGGKEARPYACFGNHEAGRPYHPPTSATRRSSSGQRASEQGGQPCHLSGGQGSRRGMAAAPVHERGDVVVVRAAADWLRSERVRNAGGRARLHPRSRVDGHLQDLTWHLRLEQDPLIGRKERALGAASVRWQTGRRGASKAREPSCCASWFQKSVNYAPASERPDFLDRGPRRGSPRRRPRRPSRPHGRRRARSASPPPL